MHVLNMMFGNAFEAIFMILDKSIRDFLNVKVTEKNGLNRRVGHVGHDGSRFWMGHWVVGHVGLGSDTVTHLHLWSLNIG
jgi:hypothetical protein